MSQQRLQKLIARAGIASRRKAEVLIGEGRVRVNGEVVTTPGAKADPATDVVEVDGRPLTFPTECSYVLLNKPAGVVTTASDEYHRKNVLDLLPDSLPRLFPVGRLDRDTEGLLLLTDDGPLTHHLTHPSNEIPKTYRAKVRGTPTQATVEHLQRGVLLEDGMAYVTEAHLYPPAGPEAPNGWLDVTVTEGRNHLVKRLLEAVGHPVVHLERTRFATLGIGDLRRGAHRLLTAAERKNLCALLPPAKG